jgi:hypothetical protein
LVGSPSLDGIGHAPAGEPAWDDPTTAVAIPLGATAALPVERVNDRRPAPVATRADGNRTAAWLGRAIVAGALLLVSVLAVVGVLGSISPSASGGLARSPSAALRSSAPSVVPSVIPSVAASVAPSPSIARPTATPDPAVAALTAMDAAISAAGGGSDGLKGKERRDLENRTAQVRKALDDGDRGKALDLAQELDRRVRDLGDHLSESDASRLRAASRDLVRALGG